MMRFLYVCSLMAGIWAASCQSREASRQQAALLLEQAKNYVYEAKVAEAIESFSKAIEADSSLAEAYFGRAFCYEEIDSLQAALRDYDRCIALDSQLADAYNNRGELKRRFLKDYTAALQDYEQAIRLRPEVAGLYFNKGLALKEMTQNDQALAAFTEAIRLSPNSAEAYFQRALLLFAAGHQARACQDWAAAYRFGKAESADWVSEYCL